MLAQRATCRVHHAFPHIGKMPIAEVTSADVIGILAPIWHDKAPTGRKLCQRIRADLLSQNLPLEDVQHLAKHDHPRIAQIYDRRRRISRTFASGSPSG